MNITRRGVLAGGAALALASRLNAAPLPDSLDAIAGSKGRHFGSAIGMGQYPDPRYRALIEAECGATTRAIGR